MPTHTQGLFTKKHVDIRIDIKYEDNFNSHSIVKYVMFKDRVIYTEDFTYESLMAFGFKPKNISFYDLAHYDKEKDEYFMFSDPSFLNKLYIGDIKPLFFQFIDFIKGLFK